MKKIASLPTEKIRDMKVEGLSDDDIVNALKPNYSNQNIRDAINQSEQEIPEDNPLEELQDLQPIESDGGDELEEAPSPEDGETSEDYPTYDVQGSMSSDQIQQIVEAVVEEKWEELTSKMGDLSLWKESMNNDVESVKQEILRTQDRINNLQNVVIGKVTEYSRGITDINTEMKALEQVFQKILQPLTSNIKDLNKVTEELKSKTILKK